MGASLGQAGAGGYRRSAAASGATDSAARIRLTRRTAGREQRVATRGSFPISGAPGAHPVGTGVGAAGGAVAGATIGSMAGKGAAESVNPTAEDSDWRDNYTRTPGYKKDYTYDDYAPAYRTGYTGWERARASGESFDSYEPTLRTEYEKAKGNSRLAWEDAKGATREAWHRVERAIPGDFDKDGR
jgi:hypothetical protein